VPESDAVVALPSAARVMVGEVERVIPKFKLGKTLLLLERLTKLLEEDSVSAVLKAGSELPNVLIEKLPQLLRTSRPAVFELLALILIPSKELKDLEDSGEGLDQRIKKEVDDLYDDADIDTAFTILNVGIDQMGIDNIAKNVQGLLLKFTKARSSQN
jgi:hypothetical protein